MWRLLRIACLLWYSPIVCEPVAAVQEPSVAEPVPGVSQDSPPLPMSERIDQLIERQAIGPLATACSDAEFVRRISLDLAGVIPSAEETRAFLADTDVLKRQKLVDRLLASGDYVRSMAMQLNVMLLERRSDKYVTDPEWERYLIEAVATRRPLDQLFQEMIFPEKSATSGVVAARFLLNREAEPNAVTRDIGRLAFGVDLQCAQCHDHPLIGQYFQQDYYGLYAFVQRTALFTDPASKKVKLSEKADGEASFKSVFTGNGLDRQRPALPWGPAVYREPVFPDGEQYTVAPAKTVPGVPKYSRRAALADLLSNSRQFQRNLANRLWAQVFGRGIVHPVDLHHSDNPPSHPELLSLLSDQLVACRFDAAAFLRELVLTRAYQRSCDAPSVETINFADIAARAEQLARDREITEAQAASLEKAAAVATEPHTRALEANEGLAAPLAERQKALQEVLGGHRKALTALTSAEAVRTLSQKQRQELRAERDRLQAAAAEQNPLLVQAVMVLDKHLEDSAAVIGKLEQDVQKKSAAAEQLARDVDNAQRRYDELAAKLIPVTQLVVLENARLAADQALAEARFQVQALDSRLALCRLCAEFETVRRSDPAKAAAVRDSLLDRWTVNGQIAVLKPLSPEQLAASAMRAVGVLDRQVAAVRAKQEAAAKKKEQGSSGSKSPQADVVALQTEVINQWRSTVRQFVSTYGGQPGEEFQATVNQALFFGNSAIVDGWLKPADDNLVALLERTEESRQLADELYLRILSRPASVAERDEVAAVLSEFPEDRPQVISELVWALLSSTEFRFNH